MGPQSAVGRLRLPHATGVTLGWLSWLANGQGGSFRGDRTGSVQVINDELYNDGLFYSRVLARLLRMKGFPISANVFVS